MQLYILGIVCMLLVLDFPIIGTEVVDSFNNCSEVFFKKQPPSFLNGSCLTGEESYKMICQVYKNHCRFATLYDTRHKIPVFSAYKYKGTTDFNLPDNPPAMVEPQLDPSNDEMGLEYENQASTRDFNKSHYVYLFPSSRAADIDTAESTFTLTNSVTLNITTNISIWNEIENEHKTFMDQHCRDIDNTRRVLAYVFTGALLDRTNTNTKHVKALSHLWTAICCHHIETNQWVLKYEVVKNEDNNLRRSTEVLFQNENFNASIQLLFNECNTLKKSVFARIRDCLVDFWNRFLGYLRNLRGGRG
uniref:DNA/RNA non-specific endonuclease/pyrophosphatase/phosphodiesterase domain-containing protein n=1 Tax=Cyprinus carpio TaxID=7962 RepID=A0A8C1S6Y9_CYPCA